MIPVEPAGPVRPDEVGAPIMDKLRVLVADDSLFMQATYRKILETDAGLTIVATASDGPEAVRKAQDTVPDVAVLDIKMPDISGIDAAGQILASCPDTGIVIVSSYEDTQYFVELLKYGSRGKAYILKTSINDIDLFIRTVRGVARGETILDPYFAEGIRDAAIKSILSEQQQGADQ